MVLVRGENVVLLGEVVDDIDMLEIQSNEALELYKNEIKVKDEKNRNDKIILESLGFCVESIQGDYY